jgi:hypothetical protein
METGATPFSGKVGQIVQLHGSSKRRRNTYDGLGDLAFIKSVAPLLGKQLQGFGHVMIGRLHAKFGSFAAREKKPSVPRWSFASWVH